MRGTFTGKLIEDGGSEGREEATGMGGLYVLQAILGKTSSKREVHCGCTGVSEMWDLTWRNFWLKRDLMSLRYLIVKAASMCRTD